VQEREFREDLYYRINVIELRVPALRQRRDDIPLLVEHVLARISGGGAQHAALTPEALDMLSRYDFPGNVRELENILERALTLSDGAAIRPEDLQLPAQRDAAPADAEDPANLESYLGGVERKLILDALERTGWNRTAAAKLLGISFRQLRYRLKKLQLD
jgi:two-component system response regulator PilR (NtrC family)